MELKNVRGKSLSRKLPCGEWITLKDGETYNFPNTNHFNEDPRLEAVKEEPEVKKVRDPFDLNDDGVVDKKDRSIAARVLGSARKRFKKRKKK